jgi:DNA (cytosine-5)-methyltransferase 1
MICSEMEQGATMKKLSVIDLFCGAGGLSEGFRQAGFHVLAGNDFFEAAGKTFEATHPEAKFFGDPIQQLSAEKLLSETGLVRGELTCLVGGPPCQAFSVYNHQRGMHDARASLFREYLRLVEGLSPEWVVMENVTGILSAGGGEAVQAIIRSLNELGYAVEYRTLKAEEFGVPQERRRVVFIGNRIGSPVLWPTPTHGHGRIPFVTVWDAIGDLPSLANGEARAERLKYRCASFSDFQRTMRGNAVSIANHQASRLSSINEQRMEHIPEGGSWRDIPHELLPAGMKKARRCDHTKRYGRLRRAGLSSTILTKCDIHWGAYIHPEQSRSLTVREAARLQSFPDWFEFAGSRTEQYVQVGNAVPPLLGRKVAEAILEAIGRLIEAPLMAAE